MYILKYYFKNEHGFKIKQNKKNINGFKIKKVFFDYLVNKF